MLRAVARQLEGKVYLDTIVVDVEKAGSYRSLKTGSFTGDKRQEPDRTNTGAL